MGGSGVVDPTSSDGDGVAFESKRQSDDQCVGEMTRYIDNATENWKGMTRIV
jgi:hypothetical protein